MFSSFLSNATVNIIIALLSTLLMRFDSRAIYSAKEMYRKYYCPYMLMVFYLFLPFINRTYFKTTFLINFYYFKLIIRDTRELHLAITTDNNIYRISIICIFYGITFAAGISNTIFCTII